MFFWNQLLAARPFKFVFGGIALLTAILSGVQAWRAEIRGHIDPESIARQTLQFSIPGTQYLGNGYEATLLLDICDAYAYESVPVKGTRKKKAKNR